MGWDLTSHASHLNDCCFFFAAQPTPTPPPGWRYSDKVEPNQGMISSLSDFKEGSDPSFKHTARDRNFTLQKSPYRVFRRSHYQDERHYETFVIGGFLREAEGSERGYESYYHGQHILNILAFEELVQYFTAESMSLPNNSPSSRSVLEGVNSGGDDTKQYHLSTDASKTQNGSRRSAFSAQQCATRISLDKRITK